MLNDLCGQYSAEEDAKIIDAEKGLKDPASLSKKYGLPLPGAPRPGIMLAPSGEWAPSKHGYITAHQYRFPQEWSHDFEREWHVAMARYSNLVHELPDGHLFSAATTALLQDRQAVYHSAMRFVRSRPGAAVRLAVSAIGGAILSLVLLGKVLGFDLVHPAVAIIFLVGCSAFYVMSRLEER